MQFFVAWVAIGIIWLWGTMLVAIFYPVIDGGYQQLLQVYRGLTGRTAPVYNGYNDKENGGTSTSPSSPSAGSVAQEQETKGPEGK